MDWDRVLVARRSARSLFGIAALAITFALMYLLTAPMREGFVGRPYVESEFHISTVLMAVGAAGVLFGLAWMWRIYKAPTKYESASWRYRDRD